MGSVYNLVDWWEPYKASKAALNNTTQTNNIKQVVLKYTDKLQVRTGKQIIKTLEYSSCHFYALFSKESFMKCSLQSFQFCLFKS